MELKVQSMSDSSKSYKVTELGTEKQWCSCPSYRFQKGAVAGRECKHTVALKTRVLVAV